MALLQGGALGLHGVVDDAARPSREIHGDQGILRHAPLFRGRGGLVKGGGEADEGSEVKQARHSHWGMTNPVCTQEQRCVGKVSKAQTQEKCAPLFDDSETFSGI